MSAMPHDEENRRRKREARWRAEDEAWDEDEDEDDDDDDYDDFEDDDDDDDDSWKIRRAATRCVKSIIATRPELLETAQTEVADVLVKRFRSESEDNVKIDLYEAFQEILKLTKSAMVAGSGPFPQAFVDANIPKQPSKLALAAFGRRHHFGLVFL